MALNTCDNVIVMCDFNIYVNKDVGKGHNKLDVSCDTLNLTNLVKSYACYSNIHKSATDIFNKQTTFDHKVSYFDIKIKNYLLL